MRELWCRQSIVAMLAGVNERLADYGAEVYVCDAYRPIACQRALWDFYWNRFSKETPRADDAALAARGLSIRTPRTLGPRTRQALRLT